MIKAESDLEREKTVRFFRESMSNRLNDEQSAIVVIMLRLHEGDVSGNVLTREPDYCHLVIPMYFRAPDAEVSTCGVGQVKYLDGQEVRLGDRVRVDHDPSGLVVACIETQEYSPEFPKAEWEYLQRGFLVRSSKYGLVHHERPDEDMELIERKPEC